MISAGSVLDEFGGVAKELFFAILDPSSTMHLTHMDMILALTYFCVSIWFICKFAWALNKRVAITMFVITFLGEIFFVDFFQKHNMDIVAHKKVVDWCDLGKDVTSEFIVASELCSAQRRLANTTKWMGAKQYVVAIWNLIWHEIFKRWATDGYLRLIIPTIVVVLALIISYYYIKLEEMGTQERMMDLVSGNFRNDNKKFLDTGRKLLEDSKKLQNRLSEGRSSFTDASQGAGAEVSITEILDD